MNIETVFFEKYINDLSSDAIKVLLKMLYLSKSSDRDVKILSNRALKRAIGTTILFANSVFNELVQHDLVIKKEKKHKTIYILNSNKIKNDNLLFDNQPIKLRRLRVTIFSINHENNVDVINLDNDIIERKIRQIFVDIDDRLFKSLCKTVQLLQQYHIEREKSFTLSKLGTFLIGLIKYKNSVIKEVCKKYNNDQKIAGLRGFKYVLRIAQGMDMEHDFEPDDVSIKEVEKNKNDGERNFAIKVALGKIESSIIYAKLLESKQFDKLKSIWHKGEEILKQDSREDEIFHNYEWLK